MEMEKYSLADIGALLNNRNDGFLEGNGIIILILFFLIFGFGGGAFGGFGNNASAQGALTRAEMYDGFNSQHIMGQLDGIAQGVCHLGYEMQGNFKDLQGALSNCCCETNRNIDAVRYENARNTCDIVHAIEKDGEKTRALITQNELQSLRDNLQTAKFQLSQQAQNATLISTLRPTPIPAYPTCSPYQAANFYGWGGCNGCNG